MFRACPSSEGGMGCGRCQLLWISPMSLAGVVPASEVCTDALPALGLLSRANLSVELGQ